MRSLLVALISLSLIATFKLPAGRIKPMYNKDDWHRPVIIPIPSYYEGLSNNLITLGKTWKVAINPSDEQWNDYSKITEWEEINIPVLRRQNQPATRLVFNKSVLIPEGFKGEKTIIRFNGVSNHSRLWINGQYVRDHWGSFMSWTSDITDNIIPGREAQIILMIDDTRTGLAAFVRGDGIQRDVQIFAVPQNFIERFHAETDLDEEYKDGSIRVDLRMNYNNPVKAKIAFSLYDEEGKKVPLSKRYTYLTPSSPEKKVELTVRDPLKWDAEHPTLYRLEVSIMRREKPVYTLTKNVGFRKIEVEVKKGNVNGREVKLRGIWGGDNVAAMKYLNINHTRQKWATEDFLDSCDIAGIYVLNEIPVDFAKNGVESDPQYAYQWLSLIAELVERDRSHPSIIMWGLGNESNYGANILKMFRYVSSEDPSKPSIFSWSHIVPVDEELPFSVYSYHYPDIAEPLPELASYGSAVFNSRSLITDRDVQPVMPVIADEYCHLVISAEELDRDPNVRNFWGESIYRFWEQMFRKEGCLGGDLFGLRSDNIRERLPENWLIKKAYSPIRILERDVDNPGEGNFEGGLGSNDFRSMKEYIYWASAYSSETGTGVSVFSDAKCSVRMEVQGLQPSTPVRVIIANEWNYPTLGLGNYMKEPIIVSNGYSNNITFRLINLKMW